MDFNGTYKDMRGTFAVVHGVIDKKPCETVQQILNQRTDTVDSLKDIQIYKKELIRIEAENEALNTALAKARKQLAMLSNKTVQEIILDDDVQFKTNE